MFEHLRHKPPTALERPREMILVCAPLRSNINLSNMLRTAGCCGIGRVIACGNPSIHKSIARDGGEQVELEVHRTLLPVLKQVKEEGFTLIGLEQTTGAQNMHHYQFPRKTALVLGNERLGLTEEQLRWMDVCVEIPVYGLPYSYNVATSAALAMYEYCRQYPTG
ncbi:TrmH family RNA methyltransferase [Anatilimnocola floriformis]|uniref:TrmH family RNA methyltransferase n=1 Tax=Anatilimnocola floriformis TaxID=2948575 RepID=UPI0020C49B0E|nr:RNA methyltransferase [Anatilimnocola floriformis]